MREIVFLHTTTSRFGHSDHDAVRAHVEPLDMYELPDADLSAYRAMIIPGGVDQELLFRERDTVRGFLDAGRVLLFSGQLVRPWLPGIGLFVPREIRSHRDYAVKIAGPHPIFANVREEDLTMRQGLAGFFARGHNPPPEGVEVLLELPGSEPIAYIDRVSTGGTMLIHSGGDLLGWGIEREYEGGPPLTSAIHIPGQLLDWVLAEAARLQAARA
jgi:hypothetical protein